MLHSIIKPAGALLLICIVITSFLAVTYSLTKDTISERALLDAQNARKEVLRDAGEFTQIENIESYIKDNKSLKLVKHAFEGIKNNILIGYVVEVTPKGYGGDIEIAVGIDMSGKITGVNIGVSNETPGLGSKAGEKPFLSQLSGFIPSQQLKVVKGTKSVSEEIDAISGATITSNAVVEGVEAAVDIAALLRKKEVESK